MEAQESLQTWKPPYQSMEKYVRQKPGLRSTISRTIRRERKPMESAGVNPFLFFQKKIQ